MGSQIEMIKVLFVLYPGVDAMDVLGPMEVLSQALHNTKDPHSKAFECTITGPADMTVVSAQGAAFNSKLNYEEATKALKTYDVMIVPGIPGMGYQDIIKTKGQPLSIIKAYSDLQQKDPLRERTLMSVGTGSLLLAHLGTLSGLCATTHPDYFAKMENICSTSATRDMAERCDVMEERYVVNNLRFDLEDPEQSQYIRQAGRRPSNARKGSNAWQDANRRGSNAQARRASLKLGGLRVITAGGTSCGIDAACYLVSAMVDEQSAQEVIRCMQHNWTKGVVVDGLDV